MALALAVQVHPADRAGPARPGQPGVLKTFAQLGVKFRRTRSRGGLLVRSVTFSMGVSLDGYIVGLLPPGTTVSTSGCKPQAEGAPC
jgi:hypothetical protein